MNRLVKKASTLSKSKMYLPTSRALSSIFLLIASFVLNMNAASISQAQEVIEHYDSGGKSAMNVHSLIRPLNLTDLEKKQLLAFLKTLTDNTFVNNPALQSPF